MEAALTAQERAPDGIVRVAGGLRQAVEEALRTDAAWVWILEGSTAPRPGALGALLDGLERVGDLPEPGVLAGVTVTPQGKVDRSRALWYRRNQIDLAMSSAVRRLLPIRASAGPALVRRAAAASELPSARAPLSAGALLEWTARMLRARVGYLVPESESEPLDDAGNPLRDPRTALRLLLGRSLVRFDRLTYGYELAERTFARSIER